MKGQDLGMLEVEELEERWARRTLSSDCFPFSLGDRARARWKAASNRSASETASAARSLAAKTREASTNVGSLSSVRACCGVLETMRLAVHSSRDGASKFASIGCRNVRCQCV